MLCSLLASPKFFLLFILLSISSVWVFISFCFLTLCGIFCFIHFIFFLFLVFVLSFFFCWISHILMWRQNQFRIVLNSLFTTPHSDTCQKYICQMLCNSFSLLFFFPNKYKYAENDDLNAFIWICQMQIDTAKQLWSVNAFDCTLEIRFDWERLALPLPCKHTFVVQHTAHDIASCHRPTPKNGQHSFHMTNLNKLWKSAWNLVLIEK